MTFALLAARFEPKPNTILQRYNFYSAYRTQGQPIKDFVAELKNLARNCEFGKTKPGVQLTEKLILEENLRDRLVCAVADMAVQRRLLSETDLDFAKAFQIAIAMESATANAADMNVHRRGGGKQDYATRTRCSDTLLGDQNRNRRIMRRARRVSDVGIHHTLRMNVASDIQNVGIVRKPDTFRATVSPRKQQTNGKGESCASYDSQRQL